MNLTSHAVVRAVDFYQASDRLNRIVKDLADSLLIRWLTGGREMLRISLPVVKPQA
jgi:hypothetical protein